LLTGLNGVKLKLDANAVGSLVKTKMNEKETSEQKALRQSLQKVIGDKGTTAISVAPNTNSAVIGLFGSSTIDPADMNRFGTAAQPNASSTFGHEVMEQYGKRVMGMTDVAFAHAWAIRYENMFTGSTRGGQSATQPDVMGCVYGDVRYTTGDQKVDVRVTVDPKSASVISVVRRDVP
jgi:hypothetical protein